MFARQVVIYCKTGNSNLHIDFGPSSTAMNLFCAYSIASGFLVFFGTPIYYEEMFRNMNTYFFAYTMYLHIPALISCFITGCATILVLIIVSISILIRLYQMLYGYFSWNNYVARGYSEVLTTDNDDMV